MPWVVGSLRELVGLCEDSDADVLGFGSIWESEFFNPYPYTLLFIGYPLPIHVGLSRRNDFLSNSDAVVLMNVSIFNGVSETQMKPQK